MPDQTEYLVCATACDGSTYARISLTAEQADGVKRVAEAVNAASRGECEPRMAIVPVEEASRDDLIVLLDREREAMEAQAWGATDA